MRMPGFTADAATALYGSTNVYRTAAFQRAAGAVTPAQGSCTCTSPDCTWNCPVPPPPDCTTTGCKRGLVCCDCVEPPICTTRLNCRRLCLL